MARVVLLVAALALAGCTYHGYDFDIDAGTGGDDAPMADAAQDPTCADHWHYAPSNFEPCPLGGTVLGPLTLTPGVYVYVPATGALVKDGSAFMTLATTGTSPRVLAIDGLTVENGASLHVAGGEPLIIAVHGDALVAGSIDASARSSEPGPGGGTCTGSAGTDATTAPAWDAGGGGGGGGFGGFGAAGGYGDAEPGQPKIDGGPQMAAVGEATLVPLRGGCGGGPGGQEDPRCTSTGTPGSGGGGGGALQLSVRDQLTLDAAALIAASGGGGGRGVNDAYGGGPHVGVGGGGGGSGGGLLLEGANVAIAATAVVCANGGGGGGGTHNNDGTITDGSDGVCAAVAAAGGSGERGTGGYGGFATFDAEAGTGGSRQDDGGGGGGGGVGRIHVRTAIGSPPTVFVSSPPALVD